MLGDHETMEGGLSRLTKSCNSKCNDNLKDDIKRENFTKEEVTLRLLLILIGLLRSGKSCDSRWNDYLRDKTDRGNFTKEEEDTIARLHQAIINRWTIIAEYLPGRSNIEIKNYWRHLKKIVRWISKPDGTSETVVLPNAHNDEKNTEMLWANESSTSTRSSAIGNLNNERYDGRSMEVLIGGKEQNSKLVKLFPEPVHNGVQQGDLAIDMTTGIKQAWPEINFRWDFPKPFDPVQI
ncbi:hypothetical protein E2562_003995 [Oryza meyeriana var. granulata]|uniref:Myb-like domain-containing protein n=1 Tax=Oryza meyeriana var. granulata TaxID=110450 RepID=A0A6G1BIU8_9ORYZ|nr:hypothetical protein E2562_003995 [Oryza meyeriana var. granulata]